MAKRDLNGLPKYNKPQSEEATKRITNWAWRKGSLAEKTFGPMIFNHDCTRKTRIAFREWLKKEWAASTDKDQDFNNPTDIKRVYGWEEIASVNRIVVSKKGKVLWVHLFYDGDRILHYDSQGGEYIESGDLAWVGDDVDYYMFIKAWVYTNYKGGLL